MARIYIICGEDKERMLMLSKESKRYECVPKSLYDGYDLPDEENILNGKVVATCFIDVAYMVSVSFHADEVGSVPKLRFSLWRKTSEFKEDGDSIFASDEFTPEGSLSARLMKEVGCQSRKEMAEIILGAPIIGKDGFESDHKKAFLLRLEGVSAFPKPTILCSYDYDRKAKPIIPDGLMPLDDNKEGYCLFLQCEANKESCALALPMDEVADVLNGEATSVIVRKDCSVLLPKPLIGRTTTWDPADSVAALQKESMKGGDRE
jgi:hypothetical protein